MSVRNLELQLPGSALRIFQFRFMRILSHCKPESAIFRNNCSCFCASLRIWSCSEPRSCANSSERLLEVLLHDCWISQTWIWNYAWENNTLNYGVTVFLLLLLPYPDTDFRYLLSIKHPCCDMASTFLFHPSQLFLIRQNRYSLPMILPGEGRLVSFLYVTGRVGIFF